MDPRDESRPNGTGLSEIARDRQLHYGEKKLRTLSPCFITRSSDSDP